MNEEPEDLLLKRLIMRDKQLLECKDVIDQCVKNIRTLIGIIEDVGDALPEPEVMRDVANYVDYPLYKEYLIQCSNLFDHYKTNIAFIKEFNV